MILDLFSIIFINYKLLEIEKKMCDLIELNHRSILELNKNKYQSITSV